MSTDAITKHGQEGVVPDRFAHPGVGVGRKGRRGKRRKDESMVPEATFTSYYGRPVIKAPQWEPLDIAGYLFLGGLAGASSVIAAGAEASGRPGLARVGKLGGLGAISVSFVALVHDLGKPARFINMLRVFKPTSPMSMGTWILSVYGPLAGVAAVTDVTGWFPRIGKAATVGAAATGPAVAAYTAVLIADTAVPAWHEGYREMPFVFVGSAAAAGAGLGMLAAPLAENGPARRAGVLGAAVELTASRLLERRVGETAEVYHSGKGGTLMKVAQGLTLAGAVGGALLGGRSRVAAAASGAALLAASACTRFGIFHAGVASAKDPKYTVKPQRERLEARQRAEQGAEQGAA
ncbi:MAG TPA: NrfD/PsrC family molybdoenzyme membrane anchor subunit [Motilibacteraceae bacterium]|nr:NrfD/PsrC family molybdoenzyme membrane anchor subunit [Motilibacteraceae bacterium]